MKKCWIRSGYAAEGGARKTQRDTVRCRERRGQALKETQEINRDAT